MDSTNATERRFVAFVPEQPAPVVVGAPGRGRENERHPAVAGELEERSVIASERGAPFVAVDERECRELRELDALLEDEDCLQPRIRQSHPTPTASRSISGAYAPVRAAAFIFARW
jgi:hypothetical protein